MYSQCPHCLTIYKVTVADLAGSHGQLACGSCDQVFDVLATLSESLPPEPIEHLELVSRRVPLPSLRQAVLRPSGRQPSLFDRPPPRSVASAGTFLAVARPRQRARARSSRSWWLGSIALVVLLVAQVLYAEREHLLTIPLYRGWADSICNVLGCRVPGSPQSLDGLQLVSRDIRRHPTVDGALLISATLANHADRERPYPVLELRLSDLDERPLAMRRFRPADYLSDSSRISRGMPPGTTLPLEFEVIDPGPSAVAFEFRFQLDQ
jgi:predicted Zn finger-like uncharacterized protein